MAINLDNLQFRQFIRFADNARSNTAIAQLGEVRQSTDPKATSLEYRKIVPKQQWDWVGRIFRNGTSRTTNDQVRAMFLNTILSMCGVSNVDDLPEEELGIMFRPLVIQF